MAVYGRGGNFSIIPFTCNAFLEEKAVRLLANEGGQVRVECVIAVFQGEKFHTCGKFVVFRITLDK